MPTHTHDKAEDKRLDALGRYDLSALGDRHFQDVADIASTICGTPMALVSFVTSQEQWFKARVGLTTDVTPRSWSFCHYAIQDDELFVVPDARQDARFRDNPLVTGETEVRFYAGAPIVTFDGFRLGTVCVLDRRPRRLTRRQAEALRALARQVIRLMETRLAYRALDARQAETLQRAESAEQASRAKSDFLAVMSHEMRTPLSAIAGATHLLGRAPELSPKHGRLIEALRASTDSLLTLLNDFLDISRIESGRFSLNEAPFRLSQLMAQVEAILTTRLAGKPVELSVTCTEPETRQPVGDAQRLQQILMNLAANAIKFTSRGSVRLSGRLEQTAPLQGLVTLNVRDTGIGIAPERLSEVFFPFTQVHAPGVTRYEGSGLGLSIVKHLIDSMHGTISVDSVPGKGTSFTVEIPLALAPL
jgi:signal transduction histidine kinase